MSQTPSRVARVAAWFGGAGAAALALGPILIQLGALSPFIGFRLFLMGALLGLLALALGVIGLWITRPAAGRAGRGPAVAGSVLGAAAVGVVLLSAGSALGLPAINDITTNPGDPPAFRAAAALEVNRGVDMRYPGESFAGAQRAAYPDLVTLRVAAPPDEALRRAREVALALGWEISGQDAASGTVEAFAVSPIFRFVDDVVVRVRPDPEAAHGSLVDVRSRSRVGKGDLGANAARIRAFLEILKESGHARERQGAAADPSWVAEVRRSLSEREYHASPNATGLQAPNRAHGIRTYFEPGGIRIVDRTAAGSPGLAELRLRAWGRGSQLAAVAPGEVGHADERVEIRRRGITEWYVNSDAGLEQGFTLDARPEGADPLVIELAVTGARPALADDRVVLATQTGRRLDYGHLWVMDADGVARDSHFEVAGSSLRIVVADAGARYPLTIDPLITATVDARIEGNDVGAQLSRVAGAGDVNGDGFADVIFGAPFYDLGSGDEGAAFVFHGGSGGIGDGDPTNADATLSTGQADAEMGTSVAGAGDVNGDGYADVIVGAPKYDDGQSDEGAAFLYLGSDSGVGAVHAQLVSDQGGALMGNDVAGAGDVNGDGYADVAVSAYVYDSPESNEGVVFVFHGSDSGIASSGPGGAQIELEVDQAEARFGWAVAGAGDIDGDGYHDLVVGARNWESTGAEDNEGAAFVFLGGSSGLSSTPHSRIESNLAGARLGTGVDGAGDVNGDGFADVIVGAPLYDVLGPASEGLAMIFHGSATGLAASLMWPALANTWIEGSQLGARMGNSVAGAGDVDGDGFADVIVGANQYDDETTDEGAAFVFLGGSSGVAGGDPATAYAQLEGNQGGSGFGRFVAGAGDVDGDGHADVLVGALSWDDGEAGEGAVFFSRGGLAGGPATATAKLEEDLGLAVAGAGDVNGDGYADVVAADPFWDGGELNEGATFVFLGGASGIGDGGPATAAARLESDEAGAQLGRSIAGAGDVDGDGYADIIVGVPEYGGTSRGAAFVFSGGAGGIAGCEPGTPPRCGPAAAAQITATQGNSSLGWSVAGAGDVDGDGYADVIVGDPTWDGTEFGEGAAFVFQGSASGIASGDASSAAAKIESGQASAGLGSSVAGAGDVNGDGYADVIVGAPYFSDGEADEGAAFVFLGSASGIAGGMPDTAAARIESNTTNAELGWSVAGAGDVDNDGYADVIVGAHFYSTNGAAFVLGGGAAGIVGCASGTPPRCDPMTASATLTGGTLSRMGESVAGAGDVDGDGYADVIVGAPNASWGAGAAYLFLGGDSGIANGSYADAETQFAESGGFHSSQFGESVAGAGDVNGDGFADLIAGAPDYGVVSPRGAVFVYHGNAGTTGRPVLAQQLRGGDPTPVAAWGSAASPDAFRVRMQATHPEGRGRVKLEVQRCGPGVPLNDSCPSYVSSSWTDVGTSSSGVTLTETIPIPFGETLSRWRARVLYAPFSVMQSGIMPPPNPAHGLWRRHSGQAVEADVRRQLSETLAVGAGMNVMASLLGGPPSWGGVDVTIGDTTGGTLSAAFAPIPFGAALQDLLLDPGSLDFYLPTDPAQLWEIDYDEDPFTGPATLTFQYDDAHLLPLLPESTLQIRHYVNGAWVPLVSDAHDMVANTITVTVSSFSPFLLAGGSVAEIGVLFSGTAQGGVLELTVGAVFLSVTTTSGQTAAQVAAAVAAAINADPTLAAAGITASAMGGSVTTNGSITSLVVSDPGLTQNGIYPRRVPSLGTPAVLLLGAAVLGAGLRARRRRRG